VTDGTCELRPEVVKSGRVVDEGTLMPNTSASQAISTAVSPENLTLYEVQKPFIEPTLRWGRLWNTALDILFYDVGLFTSVLLAKGMVVNTEAPCNLDSPAHPLATLNLSAQSNPGGCIIVVDSNLAPYVRKPFLKMNEFFEYANGPEGRAVHTLTVSGVGSSAYGSVAFAWDASVALGEPIAAIVPGYGLADVVPQALGGWLGFEVYDALQISREFCADACLDGEGSRTQYTWPRDRIDRRAGISLWQRRVGRCVRDTPKCFRNRPCYRP
jgi:hypothetical protein